MLGTELLGAKDIEATIGVRDLGVARKFYEGALGLTPAQPPDREFVTYRAGHTKLLVYKSPYAGTNKATAATWAVGDDLDEMVDALRAKAVVFEHYDMPDAVHEGDVHVFGRLRTAWFKDPDGNILSLINT